MNPAAPSPRFSSAELDAADQLLARLLRARWTGETVVTADAAALRPSVFAARLRLHGLAGLLTLRHGAQLAQLPPTLAAEVAQAHRRGVVASLAQAGAGLEVIQAFERAGIPCLPLKGQVLSWRLYGAIGVRHSGDIDVMVDPATVLPAVEVLLGLGYRSTVPLPTSALYWRGLMRTRHHTNFRDARGNYVELHWRTDPLRRTSLPPLAQLLPGLGIIADGPFKGLRQLPLELLRHSLATHAGRSRCARWKWGYDLLEIVGADGASPWDPRIIATQDPYTRHVLRSMAAQLRVPGWRRSPADALACRAVAIERGEWLRGGPGMGRTFADGTLLHVAAWVALCDMPTRFEYLGWVATRVSPEIGDKAYLQVARRPWLAPLLRFIAALRRLAARYRVP